MFDNIGGKIKSLATAITVIGIVASFILGIIQIANCSGVTFLTGMLTIVVGSLLSWVGSLALYGFGQLVESAQNIEQELKKRPLSHQPAVSTTSLSTFVVQQGKAPAEKRAPGQNEWKCSQCGRINQNYVGTCGCGMTRAQNQGPHDRVRTPAEPVRVAPGQGEWECPGCGRINPDYAIICDCGHTKPIKQPAPATASPAQKRPSAPNNAKAGPGEWKCRRCGRINQNYVGTCGCGQTKQGNTI